MTSTSLAPELSATLRRLSCWIIGLLRPLQDLHQPPALLLGQRAGLDDADPVADAQLVVLVVGVEAARADHRLLVERVRLAGRDGDDGGLVHGRRRHDALADLAGRALAARGVVCGHQAFSFSIASAAAISRARSSVSSRATSLRTCPM